MITIQDIGNEALYNAILTDIKKGLPFVKKLLKKKLTKEEALAVKRLNISGAEVENLDFLKFFPQIESLELDFVGRILDLSGLHYCTNLKEFHVSNSEVMDFREIAYCNTLTYFGYLLEGEYKKFGKSDFSFLQGLSQLDTIEITGNQLEDVSVFLNLQLLDTLFLDDNPIKTIAPLKNLPKLNWLEVGHCGLSCLEDLGEFRALKNLYAAENLFTEEQKEEYQERYPQIELNFEV